MVAKRTKTTKIEKKYKDKVTGQEKIITFDFAKVVDRINEFRSDNPNGLIETTPTLDGDQLIFKTRILKDKSNPNSAEATGHAFAKNTGSDKQFEKLETISVGRALALLGYASGGEIASSEEMEEYTSFRDGKIDEIIAKMNGFATLVELRDYFMSLGSYMAESRVIEAKDARKGILTSENN